MIILKGELYPATGDWSAHILVADAESACVIQKERDKVRAFWHTSDPVMREAVRAWLTTRACEVWARARKADDTAFLTSIEEAARLAVPEILWADLEARYGRAATTLREAASGRG